MTKTQIVSTVSRSFHKIGFQLKKYSPEILVGVGVAGVITSAVLACRATLKVNDVATETKNTIDDIHADTECGIITVEDSKKELTSVYIHTGLELAKLYAPSVFLGTFSLGCIIKSNDILRKRNGALAAAYMAIDKGFKEYRGRVVERFGKDVDRELKYNIKTKEVEETVTDEKGKEKTVKKTIQVAGEQNSEFARFFDEASREWQKNAEYNLMFLRAQQQWANDRLIADGHLFLNDVYEALDIPKTKAGQVVGWIYDPNNPEIDSYVDFGIYDIYKEGSRDFVNGYERSILLDFNIDGYILDKVKQFK